MLEHIGDKKLAVRFLRDVFPESFNGSEGKSLHGLCQRVGWKALVPGILAFLSQQRTQALPVPHDQGKQKTGQEADAHAQPWTRPQDDQAGGQPHTAGPEQATLTPTQTLAGRREDRTVLDRLPQPGHEGTSELLPGGSAGMAEALAAVTHSPVDRGRMRCCRIRLSVKGVEEPGMVEQGRQQCRQSLLHGLSHGLRYGGGQRTLQGRRQSSASTRPKSKSTTAFPSKKRRQGRYSTIRASASQWGRRRSAAISLIRSLWTDAKVSMCVLTIRQG